MSLSPPWIWLETRAISSRLRLLICKLKTAKLMLSWCSLLILIDSCYHSNTTMWLIFIDFKPRLKVHTWPLCNTKDPQKDQTSWNDPSQRDLSCGTVVLNYRLAETWNSPSALRNLEKAFCCAYLISFIHDLYRQKCWRISLLSLNSTKCTVAHKGHAAN